MVQIKILKNLYQGMFSIYLAQALKGNKIEVTGSLKRYRDFVYISDTISALMINPKSKKLYNEFRHRKKKFSKKSNKYN